MPEEITQPNIEVPKAPEKQAEQEVFSETQPEQAKEVFHEKVRKQMQVPSSQDAQQNELEIQKQARKIKNLDKTQQVQTLINLSLEQNPLLAIKTARALNSAFVLDELHDWLVSDEAWERLQAEGKIKEI